jgi:Serine hydrolase (FSH1)
MRLIYLMICTSGLFGCASLQHDYRQAAINLATQAGFSMQIIHTAQFDFTSFSKTKPQAQQSSLHVYIEGDGFAWVNQYTPSQDPTPHQPIALQLATQDTHSQVAYLARPCQFTARAQACDASYWTNKRFASDVITAMNDALNQLNSSHQAIDLIAYSGGAAIAVLLAAQRDDIRSLRTVAGNLNHAEVNTYHHVSAMPESLNPIDVAENIKKIPQLHYIGARDTVIPASVSAHFSLRVGRCAHVFSVDASHSDGWQALWPQLMQQTPSCK